MSFPTVVTSGMQQATVSSNTDPWTLTFPTGIQAGDLIVAVLAIDGNVTATFPQDWGSGPQAAQGAAKLQVGLFVATGSESGNFSVDLSGSEQGNWVCFRVTGWYGSLDGIDWAGSTGTTGSADPPSLNPVSWGTEDTLWLALMALDGNTGAPTPPSSPSTFTAIANRASSGSTGAALGSGYLASAAESMNPGQFINDSEQWGAVTLAIRPTAGVTLTPAFAEGSATAITPTVVQGSLSLTPALAEGSALAQGATVSAPLLIPLDWVQTGFHAHARASDPTVVLGSLSLTPSPAAARALGVDPAVVLSSLTLTPPVAAARGAAISPTVTIDVPPVVPAFAEASATAVAPTIDADLLVLLDWTQTGLHAHARAENPAVVLGSLSLTPLPAAARALAPNPTVDAGIEDIALSATVNIDPSGEPTTAQLTPPTGKTTGEFTAGRVQDDENPTDAVDLPPGDYTELEWAIQANVEGTFEFRVVHADGTPLDLYSQSPSLVVSAGVTLTPAPASARALAVAPAVLAPEMVTPAAAAARAVAVNPVVTAPATVTPTWAEASAVAVDPAVIAGGAIIPALAEASAVAVAPAVVLGSLTLTPAHAEASATAVNPTVSITTGVVTPEPAPARALAVAPAVDAPLTLTPAFATARAAAVAPSIGQSSFSFTPAHAEASAVAPDPVIFIGEGAPFSPAPAIARTQVHRTTLTQPTWRWRYDDGDEDGATWAAAEGVPIAVPLETTTRVRFTVAVPDGDPAAMGYRLEYRRKGTQKWYPVGTE